MHYDFAPFDDPSSLEHHDSHEFAPLDDPSSLEPPRSPFRDVMENGPRNKKDRITRSWSPAYLVKAYFDQTDEWITAAGDRIDLIDMDREHVLNSLLMLERIAPHLQERGGIEDLQATPLYRALKCEIDPILAQDPFGYGLKARIGGNDDARESFGYHDLDIDHELEDDEFDYSQLELRELVGEVMDLYAESHPDIALNQLHADLRDSLCNMIVGKYAADESEDKSLEADRAVSDALEIAVDTYERLMNEADGSYAAHLDLSCEREARRAMASAIRAYNEATS